MNVTYLKTGQILDKIFPTAGSDIKAPGFDMETMPLFQFRERSIFRKIVILIVDVSVSIDY